MKVIITTSKDKIALISTEDLRAVGVGNNEEKALESLSISKSLLKVLPPKLVKHHPYTLEQLREDLTKFNIPYYEGDIEVEELDTEEIERNKEAYLKGPFAVFYNEKTELGILFPRGPKEDFDKQIPNGYVVLSCRLLNISIPEETKENL